MASNKSTVRTDDMKKSADLVDSIVCAMRDRPLCFDCGKYTIVDNKSGMAFWVANGIFSAGVYKPFEQNFGPVQSYRFHRALKQWKIWRTQHELQTTQQ